MSIQISRAEALVADALDYRAARQDMISSNIANADTPFYKPRDISFESVLREKSREIMKAPNSELKMAQTNSGHIAPQSETKAYKPTVFFRDGHMARNDGNSVDIDVESTEMSKNSVMFNALIQAHKKDVMMFRSVIDASQKVN
jgi:flagellar basal-body rod protein FlgB